MKTLLNILKKGSSCILCLVLGAFGTLYFTNENVSAYSKINEQDEGLTLPNEGEKVVITKDEIKSKLVEIKEFVSYSCEYSVYHEEEESRTFIDDWEVWGTKNIISVDCKGVVKVSYDINQFDVEIDNVSEKVYISLPEYEVHNSIYWNSVNVNEQNNPLNPIEWSQYQSIFTTLQEKGLEEAESKSIYELAEQNITNYIGMFLESNFGYEVIFM